MKALLAGNRQGSLLQVLILVAVLAAIAAGLANTHALNVRYDRTQRQVAHLCQVREAAEHQLRTLESDDVRLQLALIGAERTNRFVDDVVRAERIAAYSRKLTSDRAYLATPLEDGCQALLP